MRIRGDMFSCGTASWLPEFPKFLGGLRANGAERFRRPALGKTVASAHRLQDVPFSCIDALWCYLKWRVCAQMGNERPNCGQVSGFTQCGRAEAPHFERARTANVRKKPRPWSLPTARKSLPNNARSARGRTQSLPAASRA